MATYEENCLLASIFSRRAEAIFKIKDERLRIKESSKQNAERRKR